MIIKTRWYGVITDGGDGSQACKVFTDKEVAEKYYKREVCQCEPKLSDCSPYDCGYLDSSSVEYEVLNDGSIRLIDPPFFATP